MALNDYLAAQRIRLWDVDANSPNGSDRGFTNAFPFIIQITDPVLEASKRDLNLVHVHDAYGNTPTILPVAGRYEDPTSLTTYDDNDATALLTDVNGRLVVTMSDGDTNFSYEDDTLFPQDPRGNVAAIGALADETATDSVDEGDIGIPRMTLNRRLIIADDFLDDAAFGIGTDYVSAIGGIYDADGSDTLDDNDIGAVRVSQKRKLLVQVSKDDNVNAEVNPIFVQVVKSAVSGTEIHKFDNGTLNVNPAGTSNHDYATVGTTFLLRSIIIAASGATKCEVWVGPVAAVVQKAVVFTSAAKPTEQIFFDPPIEVPVASTGTTRLIVRNDDNKAMAIYTTIIGNDLP